MSKEILLNVEPQETRAAIVNEGVLEEFYIERPQDKTIVGNIYKGKIEAVLPSIGAAFVDIGLPKKGFLYLSEIEYAFESIETQAINPKDIKKGQDVLVQVVKESFGTKGPRLSAHLGIAGRYLVLMPQDKQIGISRRIEDEAERKRLRQILSDFKPAKEVGFIIRTVASGSSKQELLRDAVFLLKLWKRIEKTIKGGKSPSLIYAEYDLSLRVIRDSFTEDVHKLIVDSKSEFYRIKNFMRSFLRHLVKKLEFYRGQNSLFESKDIERQINKIFETRIYLKSKAYIIIEPTEGLVVIDVNSGGFSKKLGQEETAFKVNSEAATEIARQLRLRDLGGIIVIDFIDMEREFHRREILNIFKHAMRNDRAKYDILGISKFGLVEMTRERIHNTVFTLSYQPCPHCMGRGKVKSPLTMSIYAFKELKKFLRNNRVKEADMVLNPSVVEQIDKEKNSLRMIERMFRVKINLISNPALYIEDIKLTLPDKT